ncbi:antitoxin MazE family protein [Alcaligenes faecalis]|uniref:antitoxin MazE family protein n=1 Tax=Alcaligenes faecalis TaxID=511 RepID=UPI000F0B0C3F|nr:antitoxin MazE family protein [Alcaligenes faecalis]AYR19435.1 DUF3018 family protein [Alcaligenes faecalis]
MAKEKAIVQKYCDSLRKAGLRPVQLWVPTVHRTDFVAECHRQAQRVARADKVDVDTEHFMNKALTDLEWNEDISPTRELKGECVSTNKRSDHG